jgi:hypothetical protein
VRLSAEVAAAGRQGRAYLQLLLVDDLHGPHVSGGLFLRKLDLRIVALAQHLGQLELLRSAEQAVSFKSTSAGNRRAAAAQRSRPSKPSSRDPAGTATEPLIPDDPLPTDAAASSSSRLSRGVHAGASSCSRDASATGAPSRPSSPPPRPGGGGSWTASARWPSRLPPTSSPRRRSCSAPDPPPREGGGVAVSRVTLRTSFPCTVAISTANKRSIIDPDPESIPEKTHADSADESVCVGDSRGGGGSA